MSLKETIASVKESFSEAVLDVTECSGEQIVHVKGDGVFSILQFFKDEGFDFLADLTAVDNMNLGGFERFAVVYHLLSHKFLMRVTVKAYINEKNPILPSVESLWKTADWQEREVYDLFGISFENHPDLTRIMNPEAFDGHHYEKIIPERGGLRGLIFLRLCAG